MSTGAVAPSSPIQLNVQFLAGEGFTLCALPTTLVKEVRKAVSERDAQKKRGKVVLFHNNSALVSDQTLQQQGILGKEAVVNCTFVPIDLYTAWCCVRGISVNDGEFAMDGVTRLEGAPLGQYLQNLPDSLENFFLHKRVERFHRRLDGLTVTFPRGLKTLKFGHAFNQSLEGGTLPDGLQTLEFGFWFDQSLEGVTLPDGLRTLEFGEQFNQSLEGVTLPGSLQTLKFGRAFN